MTNVAAFPSFITSYNRLKENADNVYIVELYHQDRMSEPTVSIINSVSEVFADFDDEPYISIRFDGGTDLTFTSESYFTNLSGDAVVFSSKYAYETCCIIEFRNKEVI